MVLYENRWSFYEIYSTCSSRLLPLESDQYYRPFVSNFHLLFRITTHRPALLTYMTQACVMDAPADNHFRYLPNSIICNIYSKNYVSRNQHGYAKHLRWFPQKLDTIMTTKSPITNLVENKEANHGRYYVISDWMIRCVVVAQHAAIIFRLSDLLIGFLIPRFHRSDNHILVTRTAALDPTNPLPIIHNIMQQVSSFQLAY
jgi:hypothetical protein